MKILYISNTFPREKDNSTIFTDLAEELNRRGHEIVIVASEEKRKLHSTSIGIERGMKVLRVRTGNIFDVGFIEKGISIITLVPKFINAIKKYIGDLKFDFILFECPPVTMSKVIKWAKKQFNCPSYVMLKDIFPQNAIDINIIKKDSFIHKYFSHQEKSLYKISDIIGCMSEANKQYILKHNPDIEERKVEIFPNTKDITYNSSKPIDLIMRRKYEIPENAVVAVFGGNMGRPQGIGFLMDIIKYNKNRKDIFFLIVGRGTERLKIKEFILNNKINNSLLLDMLPRQDYEALITECDIGLIFLNNKFTIPNFPSRVLSYFEYGLPVLAATDINTDFGKMIESVGAGYWVESSNLDEFNLKLNELIELPDKRILMGENGRRHLENHLHVGISADILEEHFEADIK